MMRDSSYCGSGLDAYSVKAVLRVTKVGDDVPPGKSGHAPSTKKEAHSFQTEGCRGIRHACNGESSEQGVPRACEYGACPALRPWMGGGGQGWQVGPSPKYQAFAILLLQRGDRMWEVDLGLIRD